MLTSDVISHFGSRANAAKAIGIGLPAIAKWAKAGMVPPLSAARIQALTKGKLRFDVADYSDWYSKNRKAR